MRVDALCDVAASVAEKTPLCRLVGSGIIKQRRHRVPAVMRSMAVSVDEMHNRTPDGAVPAIIVRLSRLVADECITWEVHVGLDERCDAVMYRDDADAGGGLALCDADIALSQMNVRFLQL